MPARSPSPLRPRTSRHAILVAVQHPEEADDARLRSLAELQRLCENLQLEVAGTLLQKRSARSPSYLGRGKIDVLRELAGSAEGAPPLVVVDDELRPSEQRALELASGLEVLDRSAVILRIFEARARTPEALLEVELARLTYELPRLRDDPDASRRQGGGGGRGERGHTATELAKDRVRARITALRQALEKAQAAAEARRLRRQEQLRAALVGYTNAGKSSLMRALTGSEVLVEDRLFATLGTTVRVVPKTNPRVLLTDTVGFIDRLPHGLVASFHSTLAEVHEAGLLLVVVDASDPAFRAQLEVTQRVLEELGASEIPRLLLLNKIDLLDTEARRALAEERPEALQVSAHDAADIERLRAAIGAAFEEGLETAELVVPWRQIAALEEERGQLAVLEEVHGEALRVKVRGLPAVLGRLTRRLAER